MDTAKAAKIMKALSNQNRLELFLDIARQSEEGYMAGKGCFITDIACSFTIGAPTMSHHLKELVNAGLITTERQGKFLIARIVTETLDDVKKLLNLELTAIPVKQEENKP
jgi:DNA-binding transcriptional ArsR family regulator